MPFPPNIKEDALVACGRHCSICHKFCGLKIEVHHIIQESDGGENIFDNAIPLCLECHADMFPYDPKHPKGTKYTSNELKRHRDNWYKKVEDNIGLAKKEEIVETDKKVFEILIQILPWDGSINFIKYNDFGGSFLRSNLNDLRKFIYECENPFFEFIDPDLEGLRVGLQTSIDIFMETIATETFTTDNVDANSIPREMQIHNPKRFREIRTSINNKADCIFNNYELLVKNAVRKLGVLPSNQKQ